MNRFTYIQRFCVAITLATLMAAPVVAQVKEASPPADTVSTITVTGVRLQKNETRKQARSYVGKTTITTFSQYTRQGRPIYPSVIGIDLGYAQIVTDRVVNIAKLASIPVKEGKCVPNIFILFNN